MAEAVGIKETKEAVVGLIEIAALLGKVFKDGVQATDALEVWSAISADEELKAKLVAAYNEADQIPAEVKDLSVMEGIELLTACAPGVVKIAQALGK
jgi:hypothetical protein